MKSNTKKTLVKKATIVASIPICIALSPFSPKSEGILPVKSAHAQSYEERKVKVSKNFSYEVRGCKKDKAEPTEKSVNVEVCDNTATIKLRLDRVNCGVGLSLSMRYTKKGNELTIKGLFKGPWAKCICDFEVDAKVSNLKKGKYTVKVVYEEKYEGKTTVKKNIGEETFTVE